MPLKVLWIGFSFFTKYILKMKKQLSKNSENEHFIDEKSHFDHITELKKAYKASDKTIQDVMADFPQGDHRYFDPWESVILAGFLDNNAIDVKEIEEKLPEKPNKSDLAKIKGPQKIFKFYASKIAEKQGFKVKEYEPSASGGKADILAFKKGEMLLIECCSCRISKAIDYLSIKNTILWLMLKETKNGKITIFEFSKGENWKNFKNFHEEYMMNQTTKYYEKLSKLWIKK